MAQNSNLLLSHVILASTLSFICIMSHCNAKSMGLDEMDLRRESHDFKSSSEELEDSLSPSSSSSLSSGEGVRLRLDNDLWSPQRPSFFPGVQRSFNYWQGNNPSTTEIDSAGIYLPSSVNNPLVLNKRFSSSPSGSVSVVGAAGGTGTTGTKFGNGNGNYLSNSDLFRLRPMNYNLRSFAAGRHGSAFNSQHKRQILFRQCFFNPISCF